MQEVVAIGRIDDTRKGFQWNVLVCEDNLVRANGHDEVRELLLKYSTFNEDPNSLPCMKWRRTVVLLTWNFGCQVNAATRVLVFSTKPLRSLFQAAKPDSRMIFISLAGSMPCLHVGRMDVVVWLEVLWKLRDLCVEFDSFHWKALRDGRDYVEPAHVR